MFDCTEMKIGDKVTITKGAFRNEIGNIEKIEGSGKSSWLIVGIQPRKMSNGKMSQYCRVRINRKDTKRLPQWK